MNYKTFILKEYNIIQLLSFEMEFTLKIRPSFDEFNYTFGNIDSPMDFELLLHNLKLS